LAADLEIYVSTGSLPYDLLELIRQTGRFPDGYGLEFGAGFSREDALFLLDAAETDRSIPILIHNYFPPPEGEPFVLNLASSNAWVRDRSLDLCRESMMACIRVSAPFYSVHAGLSVDPAPKDLGQSLAEYIPRSLEEARGIFRENVEELATYANELGLDLLLENNVLAAFNAPDNINRLTLFCGLEDFRLFDQFFPQNNVGVLLDMGHLKVSSQTLGFDPEEAAYTVMDRTLAIHLHDNDGLTDGHQCFGRKAWFMNLIPKFRPDTKLIIETRPLSGCELYQLIDLLHDIRN